jgi:hypothetical protein
VIFLDLLFLIRSACSSSLLNTSNILTTFLKLGTCCGKRILTHI